VVEERPVTVLQARSGRVRAARRLTRRMSGTTEVSKNDTKAVRKLLGR